MQAATDSSLNPEQKAVLGTVFHFLESATIYFQSVLPVVCEEDELVLKGLLELGGICMKRLPEYFPELQALAEEWKKNGMTEWGQTWCCESRSTPG